MKRKVFYVWFALMMSLSLLVTAAGALEFGEAQPGGGGTLVVEGEYDASNEAEFLDAIGKANKLGAEESSGWITLKADITLTETVTLMTNGLTDTATKLGIKLNGYTLTGNLVTTNRESACDVRIRDDSVAQTGKLVGTLTEYNSGRVFLYGGTYGKIEANRAYELLLGDGDRTPFSYWDADGKEIPLSEMSKDRENVTIAPHTACTYDKGVCKYCKQVCAHTGSGGTSSTCGQCGMVFPVCIHAGDLDSTGGHTYYVTFENALTAAKALAAETEGGEVSVRLMDDVTVSASTYAILAENETVTLHLDLNGHRLGITSAAGCFQIKGGTLNLYDYGEGVGEIAFLSVSTTGLKLYGGKIDAMELENEVTYADVLGKGFTYTMQENEGEGTYKAVKLSDLQKMNTSPTFLVRECDGHTYDESGHCEYCGATCRHLSAMSGICNGCGKQMLALVVGRQYYLDLGDALAAAEDGDTIKMLTDLSFPGEYSGGGTMLFTADFGANVNVTLELNGKKLRLYNGNYAECIQVKSGSLTVRDSAGGGSLTRVNVETGGALTVESGTVTNVYVFGGTAFVKGGSIDRLNCMEAGNVRLTGGTFLHFEIKAEGVKQRCAFDTLEDGYAFQSIDNGALLRGENEWIDRVSVVKHTEHTFDTDGLCACGRKSIATCGINVRGEYTYDGSAQTARWDVPEYLRENVDYTLTGELSGTNAGTYTAILTGKGSYAGVATKEWTILPMDLKDHDFTMTVSDKAYDGSAEATVTSVGFGNGTVLVYGIDYVTSASFSDANVGKDKTVEIILFLSTEGNYVYDGKYWPTFTTTASITKAVLPTTPSVGWLTVYHQQAYDYEFDFATLLPTLPEYCEYGAWEVNGYSLDVGNEEKEYITDIQYAQPFTGKVTFCIANVDRQTEGKIASLRLNIQSQNYQDFDLTLNVTAKNKEVKSLAVSMGNWVYGGTPDTVVYEMPEGASDWSIRYAPADSDAQAAERVPTQAGDYNVFVSCTTLTEIWRGVGTFTIAKAVPTGAPKYTEITSEGKTLADAMLTVEGGSFTVPGTVKWIDAEGNALADTTAVSANTAYQWRFVPTDERNYAAIDGSITLWHRSSSNSGSNSGSLNINPDGTMTTTRRDPLSGTVTETTKHTDGSTTVVETRRDGTVATSRKTASGTVTTTVTDREGTVLERKVTVSEKDTASGTAFTLPVDEVKLTERENAEKITVEIPQNTTVTVEIPVENVTAGTVVIVVNEDGTETVVATTKMTEKGVAITLSENATIKIVENAKEFDDVPENEFYSEAVDFASAREITDGMSETTFGVTENCCRAQLITLLWRAAGCPEAEGDMTFTDVVEDSYYAAAARWAASLGIAKGYDDGRFGVEDTVTREQMAVMIYRYVQSEGGGFTGAWMYRMDYKDLAEVSDWAFEAIAWCSMNGIMQGSDGYIMPQEPCIRAQIVTMLYRLLNRL